MSDADLSNILRSQPVSAGGGFPTERVAEAMYREHTNASEGAWQQIPDVVCDNYRRMAEAAIDALGLTEETQRLPDGMGGMTVHADGSVTTTHMKPQTQQRRFVSAWVPTVERSAPDE